MKLSIADCCLCLLFEVDLKTRRNLSFSEDSDLSCDDVLERSSQKSKADVSKYKCHVVVIRLATPTELTGVLTTAFLDLF